jgi:Hairy Orange
MFPIDFVWNVMQLSSNDVTARNLPPDGANGQQMPSSTYQAAHFGCSLDFRAGYQQCLADTVRYIECLETVAGRLPTHCHEEEATDDFSQVR